MSFLCPRALAAPRAPLPIHFSLSSTIRCPNAPTRASRFRSISKPSPPSARAFNTTPRHHAIKTIQQAASRAKSGPFSARAAIIFLVAGAGMIFYFRQEKAKMERQRVAEQAKGVGRPKVGGEFNLIDQEGKTFTDGDMKGGFSIVSRVHPPPLQKTRRVLERQESSYEEDSAAQNIGEIRSLSYRDIWY